MIGCCLTSLAADEEAEGAGEDSAAGLSPEYAKNYLVAASTVSPDKKFAVMYPTLEFSDSPKAKDYLVALHPFAILGALQTKWPHFQNKSHGGISGEWSPDSSVALITLDSKWGPGDIFLVELHDGKLNRMTNILAKAHDLLRPDYRKVKAEPYNDLFDFIFDSEGDPVCKLDGAKRVLVNGHATSDPKGISKRIWSAQLKAVWDIPQAKFTEQKITRE